MINMTKLTILLISTVFFFACAEEKSEPIIKPIETISDKEIDIKIFDYKSFKPLLEVENDTTYVINFWATWCRPCVKELPYFEKINEKYKNEKVKVILVSLDFKKKVKELLIPFLEKKQLKSEVILLSEADANFWINDISKDWSGAIPATIIKKGKSFDFYEQDFEFEELDKLVSNTILD